MEDITREEAKKSLIKGTNNKKHICETLRMVYDRVHEMPDSMNKDVMTELLIDAMWMAKKMQNRLVYYQKTYKDTTGHEGKNFIGLTGVKARAKMRKVREL